MSAMRLLEFLIAFLMCIGAVAARSQPESDSPTYQDLFYASGNLRIQAYLYKPDGDGPFPAVIYNHGSRDGHERASVPFQYVGRMLARAGYVALVPERRGYGKSDGEVWWKETGNDPGKLIVRLQAETDDVLAAADYLRTVKSVDPGRLGIMGWSFGGIVTMLAVSRSGAFRAAVNQAGGALSWDGNPVLRDALTGAARKTATPTLLMVARNDRTTSSITTLADVFKNRGLPHEMVIYEPFTPRAGTRVLAPGHAVFSAQGLSVWETDVVRFLGRYLGASASSRPD
jgi:dienelactone hydrolase